MKQLISLMIAIGSLAAAGTASAEEAVASTPGYEVLVFWASWCGRCDAVLKDMDSLQHNDALSGVAVKAVNIGDGDRASAALLRKGGGDLRLVENGQELAKELSVKALPWVVVVDSDGRPVYEPSRNTAPTQVAKYVQMDLALRL